jgi:hypothetical protein
MKSRAERLHTFMAGKSPIPLLPGEGYNNLQFRIECFKEHERVSCEGDTRLGQLPDCYLHYWFNPHTSTRDDASYWISVWGPGSYSVILRNLTKDNAYAIWHNIIALAPISLDYLHDLGFHYE